MVVPDDKKLARSFNEHYFDTFVRSNRLKSEKVELDNSINTNKKVLESILNSYKNQRYIQKLAVVTISFLMF